jgi:hypothetical protein
MLQIGPRSGTLRGLTVLSGSSSRFRCDPEGAEASVYVVRARLPRDRFPAVEFTIQDGDNELSHEGSSYANGAFVPLFSYFRGQPCTPTLTSEGARCSPTPVFVPGAVFRDATCQGFVTRSEINLLGSVLLFDSTQSTQLLEASGHRSGLCRPGLRTGARRCAHSRATGAPPS